MSSPSPLHPPESVRRFTSLKVGVLLLFVLLLTLFGVREDEGGAQPEAPQQLASTHVESIDLPLGGGQAGQEADATGGRQGRNQAEHGADGQADAQGAGQPDESQAEPSNAPQHERGASRTSSVGEGIEAQESMTDLAAREPARAGGAQAAGGAAAASSAGGSGPNEQAAGGMAPGQAGPAAPAGESVMNADDDDQPPQPATGDAMIELPGPPAFSLAHDPARGIRLAGEVPDDDTRNQWMNAIRLGARGEPVEGGLRLRRIDGHAAARWEPQLTALVALVRERNISELRVRGDVVEVFGGADTPAQGRETLELIRAQVPNGYRVLARNEAGRGQGASRLAAAGAAGAAGSAAHATPRLADANRLADRDARAQADARQAGRQTADARKAAQDARAANARDARSQNARDSRNTGAQDARQGRDSRNTRDTRQAAADNRNARTMRTAAAGNCPRSLKQLSAPIFFKSGSANLSPAETRRLQQLGACLGRTAWVRVTGHADPRYSAAYNKTLSERRARAVAAAISEGGFSSARITVVGAGQTSSRARSRTDKATLQRARRVDILVG